MSRRRSVIWSRFLIKSVQKRKKLLTFLCEGVIIYKQSRKIAVIYAGMAELADARDLKSREIHSRAGSSPVSGTIYIAG